MMLEVLRSLTADRRIDMKSDIIFHFNDGEESGLLGTYKFVTNHKWAKDVIAFMNLEAMGSGGKDMLFQVTSKKLMSSYINAASYPFAMVFGQESFQSGVVPSVTDFQIFQDYLNIGGLDIAFIEHGYVYHTKYDTSENDDFDFVFFDMLGLFMISYSWDWFGKIWSYSISLLTFVIFASDIYICTKLGGIHIGSYQAEKAEMKVAIKAFLTSICGLIVSVPLSGGFTLLTAYVLGLTGNAMSWYSSYSFLFLLCSTPVMGYVQYSFLLWGRTTTLGNPDISIGLITTLSTIIILPTSFLYLSTQNFTFILH